MSTDMEPHERQEAAEVAFAIEGRIKDAQRRGRQALWDLAEALYEFDQEHGWMALGHETLSDWLADPEVTMTMGTYRRYVRTWRKLVVEKQIEPTRLRQLEQSKVAIVVDKVAANEVLVDDALADVEALGAKDLREKYYNRRDAEPEPSNVGQEDDLGQKVADEYAEVPEVEPVSGETLAALAGLPTEPQPEPEVIEGTATEVVEEPAEAPAPAFVGYEFPGWVTEGSVRSALSDLASAFDSGAGFPRIGRRSVQVCSELAKAWLQTRS